VNPGLTHCLITTELGRGRRTGARDGLAELVGELLEEHPKSTAWIESSFRRLRADRPGGAALLLDALGWHRASREHWARLLLEEALADPATAIRGAACRVLLRWRDDHALAVLQAHAAVEASPRLRRQLDRKLAALGLRGAPSFQDAWRCAYRGV